MHCNGQSLAMWQCKCKLCGLNSLWLVTKDKHLFFAVPGLAMCTCERYFSDRLPPYQGRTIIGPVMELGESMKALRDLVKFVTRVVK